VCQEAFGVVSAEVAAEMGAVKEDEGVDKLGPRRLAECFAVREQSVEEWTVLRRALTRKIGLGESKIESSRAEIEKFRENKKQGRGLNVLKSRVAAVEEEVHGLNARLDEHLGDAAWELQRATMEAEIRELDRRVDRTKAAHRIAKIHAARLDRAVDTGSAFAQWKKMAKSMRSMFPLRGRELERAVAAAADVSPEDDDDDEDDIVVDATGVWHRNGPPERVQPPPKVVLLRAHASWCCERGRDVAMSREREPSRRERCRGSRRGAYHDEPRRTTR